VKEEAHEIEKPAKLPAGLCLALSDELQALALIHRREASDTLLDYLRDAGFPQNMSLKLVSDDARTGAELLGGAILDLSSPLSPGESDELAADYAAIYLNHGYQASPYESVWLTEEHLTQQEPMFQVRQQYRTYGLAVPDWRIIPDDHISFQLEFISRVLALKPDPPINVAAEFMDQHLLRWVGEFGARISVRCATPFYAGAALLTAAYCDTLRDILAAALGTARPAPEEIEKRDKESGEAEPRIPLVYIPGTEPSW